jgi:hypothetical protein
MPSEVGTRGMVMRKKAPYLLIQLLLIQLMTCAFVVYWVAPKSLIVFPLIAVLVCVISRCLDWTKQEIESGLINRNVAVFLMSCAIGTAVALTINNAAQDRDGDEIFRILDPIHGNFPQDEDKDGVPNLVDRQYCERNNNKARCTFEREWL